MLAVEAPDSACFGYTDGQTIYFPPVFFELRAVKQILCCFPELFVAGSAVEIRVLAATADDECEWEFDNRQRYPEIINNLINLALERNQPVGGFWEYNERPYDRALRCRLLGRIRQGGDLMADRYGAESQIDITYHYPPELLELLCDAVPALFRSKQGVVDFFVGAGVGGTFLSDWKVKVREDRDNVRKAVLARSVLCRLNDAGEPALAQRREVLKRICEFDDFSSCWDGDRLKAQGLVAQIQKVVNVKDSFMRMNLEREREREQRQTEYKAQTLAKQKAVKECAAIQDALYRLFRETNAWKRGKQLEGILNRLFAFGGFLVREAFTIKGDEAKGIVEQTD